MSQSKSTLHTSRVRQKAIHRPAALRTFTGECESVNVAGTTAAPDGAASMDPGERRRLIAQSAYYRAERRGFTPGCEVEDWLAAERDLEQLLP